jgi:hypothetical protein
MVPSVQHLHGEPVALSDPADQDFVRSGSCAQWPSRRIGRMGLACGSIKQARFFSLRLYVASMCDLPHKDENPMPIGSVVSERATKRYHNKQYLSLNHKQHSQGAERKTAQAGICTGPARPGYRTPFALPGPPAILFSDQRVRQHRRVAGVGFQKIPNLKALPRRFLPLISFMAGQWAQRRHS